MRINGFEQMKAFYSWVFDNADKQVKPQHISLYVFLLNQNNRANWVEWFKCPYDLAMQGACIGNKKTYYNCLRDLEEWKLIKYEKGVNEWKAPIIKVEVLKCTTSVPQSEPQHTPQDTPQHTPQGVPQHTHIYKPITGNSKPKTDNTESVPSRDDFINYGLSKDSTLNRQALGLKYDSWVEMGWRTGKDKPIKRWKATLLNTIPYIPKDEKKPKRDVPDIVKQHSTAGYDEV